MTKCTTLETSRKLYEAFPEWGDTERVYYSNGGIVDDSQTFGRNMVFAKDGNVPAYDTDYLLEKLPKKIKRDSSTGWLVISPMDKDTWGVGYEADHTEHIDIYPFEWNNVLVEALAILAIKLKKEGLL